MRGTNAAGVGVEGEAYACSWQQQQQQRRPSDALPNEAGWLDVPAALVDKGLRVLAPLCRPLLCLRRHSKTKTAATALDVLAAATAALVLLPTAQRRAQLHWGLWGLEFALFTSVAAFAAHCDGRERGQEGGRALASRCVQRSVQISAVNENLDV